MRFFKILFFVILNVTCHISLSQGAGSFPYLWNIPRFNDNFVGRGIILKSIKAYYSQKSNGILCLTGISGIGKSEIAKYYINQHYSNYNIVWWFDAQGDFEAQFYEFSLAWNRETKNLEEIPLKKLALSAIPSYVMNALRTTKFSWFLIFDNATDLASISEYFPLVHYNDKARKNILITSQNHSGWANKIEVPPFSREEATLYLQKILRNYSDAQFLKLVNGLNLHPFYLVQTGDYIHLNNIPVELFLKNFENQTIKTGALILKKNLETVARDQPLSYSLLEFISIFDGEKISHAFLEKFFHKKTKNDNIFECLDTLNRYSLLDHKTIGTPSKKYYTIHDIILKLVQSNMNQETQKQNLTIAIKTMNEVLNMRWVHLAQYAMTHPEEMAHALKLWNKAQEHGLQNVEVFILGKKLLENHVYHTRNHRLYEKIYADLRNLLESIGAHKINRRDFLEFQLASIYIRGTYFSKEKIENMKQEYLNALNYFQEINDTEEILRTYYCLAQFYLFQGMLEKAQDYITQARTLFPLSASPTNQSLYLYVKSWIHLEAGEYDETNKAVEELLTFQKDASNYSLLLHTMSMRCSSLVKQNKYDAALKIGLETILKANAFYQSEINEIHGEVSTILANIYVTKKDFQLAEKAILKSIDVYTQYFGKDELHADQAYAHQIAGFIYEKLKKYPSAIAEYMKAVATYAHLYKDSEDKINDLSELYEKLALLGIKIGKEDLTQKYLALHIKRFGFDHPRTKNIFQMLDDKGLSHLFS